MGEISVSRVSEIFLDCAGDTAPLISLNDTEEVVIRKLLETPSLPYLAEPIGEGTTSPLYNYLNMLTLPILGYFDIPKVLRHGGTPCLIINELNRALTSGLLTMDNVRYGIAAGINEILTMCRGKPSSTGAIFGGNDEDNARQGKALHCVDQLIAKQNDTKELVGKSATNQQGRNTPGIACTCVGLL